MKHCKAILFFLLLAMPCIRVYSQNDKTIVRFIDRETQVALSKVRVITTAGVAMGISDKDGYMVLPIDAFVNRGALIALRDGYKADTLLEPKQTYYLSHLSVELVTATISGSTVKRVLNLPSEYVVDYAFRGNNILTTTFSGNNGRKAKLLLLNSEGKEITRCNLPEEPLGLYTSCLGMNYCVCYRQFYPLDVSDSSVALSKPYPIRLLSGLQQCELSIDGNMYYRIAEKQRFRVTYGMIPRGDSVFKTITIFEEREEARSSMIEAVEIIQLYDAMQFAEASRKAGLRRMWDKGLLAHINVPLHTSNDTLVIFDYFKKKILFFDTLGTPLNTAAVGFEWKQSQQFSIIRDDVADKIYVHRYDNQGHQTIRELNVHDGKETGPLNVLVKPFADKVKVHGGKIYYLWQDGKAGATQQLFTQLMDQL